MEHITDNELVADIRYGTNIIPEEEFIETLVTIADVASDMVVKTLGPYGRTTLLNDGVFTYPTKDGWSVLKSLRFNDATFNVLYGILKQISFDMVTIVGDNTTGAFVGSVKFIHRIIDDILTQGYRQSDVVDAIKNVAKHIIEEIESSKYVKQCTDEAYEDIYKIARVASNGNDELSEIIQKIYQETNNPNIYVSLDPGKKLDYEIQTGYKFDCNPIQQKLYINTENRTYEESNPSLVMIFDHNVNYQDHNRLIGAISQYSSMVNKSVLILAPYFDDIISNVIGSSIESLAQQGKVPNIMLVQVPLSNTAQRTSLSDVVLLSNAQVIDAGKVKAFNLMVHKAEHPQDKIEDHILNAAQYHFESTQDLIASCAGQLMHVIVGQKYMLIQEYDSVVNKNVYEETLKEVHDHYIEMKEKMEKSTNPLFKDYMEAYQHYTKLSGKLGVLKVGGASELEKHYMKDVVDDAVLACRSAFNHGYERGLNLTILNIINDLNCEDFTRLERRVTDIFFDTFFQLSLEVFKNSNEDLNATYEVNDTRNSDEICMLTPADILNLCIKEECGFDIVKCTIMSDDDCTIVNSVKSDTETINAMVGILSVVLTSNQFLTINRAYDRKIGMKQRQEMLQKSEAAKYGAIAEEIYDRLKNKISLFSK